MSPIRLLPALAVLCLPCGSLLAHDDDPKVLDRQAPYRGPAFRRASLAAPGGVALAHGAGLSAGLSGRGTQALGGNPFAANGIELLSWLPLSEFGSPATGSDCWGYTSPSGREYALFCHSEGMSVVDVTNPFDAQLVDTVDGPGSLWRDVKVFQDKAYVVSEGGSGVQVVDLAQVDAGLVVHLGNITSGGSTATHNVVINEDSGFLYRTGGGSNLGLRVYDLNQSLTNPPLVASWTTRYIHDAQVVSYTSGPYAGKEIAFCCSGYNNGGTNTGLDVLDVTNKNNIQVLANVFYSNPAYSHQGWLSADRQYFFLGDELDENGVLPTKTFVMDVSNLNSPFEATNFTNGNTAVGHNLYTLGDLIFAANYRSGLRVFDASNPMNPTEVAWFDTYPSDDGDGFNGLWSVYPYFESGTVIGSDLERGLFVLWMGQIPLEFDLASAPTLVEPTGDSTTVTITEALPGDLAAGSAKLHLRTGGSWTSYDLVDQGGGSYAVEFPSLACGTAFEWYISAQSTRGGTWTEPRLAPSELYSTVAASAVLSLASDDFEASSGWTGGLPGDDATTGIWELVDPNGTSSQTEDDHTASGTQCWVTGQGSPGGSLGQNDVDGGTTTLLSPNFDLSGAQQPTISYWRWYSNDGNSAVDDDFVVEVSANGSTWVEVERLGPSHPEASGGWFQHSFSVASFVTPSATTRLRFVASDLGSGSIVEAAVDDLEVLDVDCGGCSGSVVSNYCTASLNSFGSGAQMGSSGSTSLAANDLVLSVNGALPNKPGLFYYGPAQASAPFGDGTRCVGAGGVGIFRLPPVQIADSLGTVTRAFDLSAPPASSGAGMISEGETWYFQYWYRDVAAGGAGFNLSDGLAVDFCP